MKKLEEELEELVALDANLRAARQARRGAMEQLEETQRELDALVERARALVRRAEQASAGAGSDPGPSS